MIKERRRERKREMDKKLEQKERGIDKGKIYRSEEME